MRIVNKTNLFSKWFIIAFVGLLLLQCSSKGQQENSQKDNNRKAFQADIEIALTATTKKIQLLQGEETKVFTYESELIKGKEENLDKLKDTYLGPIIHVKQGQKIRVRFKNQLPRESIIHWHGLHIPPEMDGHPVYAINKGEEYIYEFQVNNRPGTYWFHPHPHQITGPQVYYGLAGMFIVEGDEPELPSGEFDMPMILQDRTFDANNQLVYLEGNRMERMKGFLGNRILVNGLIDRQMEVKKTAYRFRVLNGSNSRIYKLAWSDGSNVIAVGTGGGLLEQPVKKDYIMLAPGERVDIWKNFSDYNENKELKLKSLAFNDGTSMSMGGGMGGRMGNMQPSQGVDNGTEMDLYTFTVTSESGPQKKLPSRLSDIKKFDANNAVNADNPKPFNFSFERMNWVINGETFDMTEVADWEKVKLNTTEIWEFINGGNGGGMGMMNNMMQMPHPVHIHGLQFQIIDRDISGVSSSSWETVKDGFLDKGWQDTFLLLPGMKVQVIMRFEDFTGKYIYHCHNLEHEDMGMMRNYEVVE